MVAHVCNPGTLEAKAGGSSKLQAAWSIESNPVCPNEGGGEVFRLLKSQIRL